MLPKDLPAAALLVLLLDVTTASATGSHGAEWMEILPFSSWHSRAVTLQNNVPAEVAPSEKGAALVCSGAHNLAITCEERYLRPGEPIEPPRPRPGVAVRGRVLVDGEAASGVRVALVPAALTARRPLRLPLSIENGNVKRELVTDIRGRFSTPPLATSTYRIELIPPGGRIELLEPFFLPPLEDLLREEDHKSSSSLPPHLDLGDFEVSQGLAVQISVIDDSGAPVGGAVVSASQGRPPARVTMFESNTDAEGRTALHGFEPSDPIETTCAKPGFSRLEKRFDFPPTWVECVLQPVANLVGEVLSDGQGLANATVSLPNRDRWARTDSSGRFQLMELDAGAFHLVIAAPGFEIAEQHDTLAPGERRTEIVELEPSPRRWGQAVDAVTGKPVADARLASMTPRGAVDSRSNHEGEFFFEAASDRTILLEVSARNYPPRRVELGPEDGTGDEPWVVELEKGGRVDVVVWNPSSDGPCVGCDLVIAKVATAGAPAQLHVSLRTGADGLATSEELATGRYRVILEEVQSMGSAVHVRSGNNVRFADVRPGEVTEVVFGEPRQEVEIRFRPLPSPGWRLRCEGTEGEEVYDAQVDGSYKVRRRPREALNLRLEGNGISVSQGILAANAEDLVYFDLPRTSVSGHLSHRESAAGPQGLRIRPLIQNGSGAWVMPTLGRFEVRFLPPGSYRITSGGQELAQFHLERGQALDLGKIDQEMELE